MWIQIEKCGRIHVNHISEIPVMEHLAMENDEKNVDLPMNNGDFPGKSLVYQRVYDFILGGTCCPYNLIFAWHLAPCAAVALYFSKPSSSKRFLMKYSTAWGRKDQERSTRNWWNSYGHNWEAIKNHIYHIYIYHIRYNFTIYTNMIKNADKTARQTLGYVGRNNWRLVFLWPQQTRAPTKPETSSCLCPNSTFLGSGIWSHSNFVIWNGIS